MSMPEKSVGILQGHCLEMCRQRLGCGHLQRVLIGRTRPSGGGSNWEVLAFEPELGQIAHAEAMKAIDILGRTYALAAAGRR
jgi:hypothetical protein